jgi:glucose-1-phosphate cytidylyltransferase
MTGGRLRRVAPYVQDEDVFCFTYGDGLGDIDISATLDFHKQHGKAATLTATYPPGRFGALDIQQGQVLNFKEKPKGDGAMINGGFFVLTPKVFHYLTDDSTVWEQEPLKNLAADGQLMAYEHHGFWQPMDTLRDKHLLEELWQSGKAPWQTWQQR